MRGKPPVRKMLPILSIVGNPRNDNVHPVSQVDALQASIKNFGQPQPVLVRTANKMLIAGHGIHEAMVKAGETQIDCLLWDTDQPTADAFMLASNRLGELSYADPGRRRQLLIVLAEDEWGAVGFLPDEVAEILDQGEDPITVREVETGPVADTFWISARGPLKDQAAVLQKMREVMAEFPDVEVNLGTLQQQADFVL